MQHSALGPEHSKHLVKEGSVVITIFFSPRDFLVPGVDRWMLILQTFIEHLARCQEFQEVPHLSGDIGLGNGLVLRRRG